MGGVVDGQVECASPLLLKVGQGVVFEVSDGEGRVFNHCKQVVEVEGEVIFVKFASPGAGVSVGVGEEKVHSTLQVGKGPPFVFPFHLSPVVVLE